jgi:uncharacterized protein
VKLSRYRRIFAPAALPGERVLFSTRTAAAVRVPEALLEEIERGALSPAEGRTLADLGLLVEDPEAERRGMLGFLDDLALKDRSLGATVVLTMDCNLACTYCFEGTRRGAHRMTPATAREVAAFLRRSRFPGQEELFLTFYGGEPLLAFDTLRAIASAVRADAAADGIACRFSVTTNGTLLTPARARELRALGIERASVTLDGPREIHDACRPRRAGAGSYDAIISNLREAARILAVQIGGNYLSSNWREMPRLLEDLAAADLGPAVLSDVRFDPVLQEREGIAPPDFRGGCLSTNEPWLREAVPRLRGEVRRRGYEPPRITPTLCTIDRPRRFVIGWDGSIYKCPGLIGRPEFRVGDLTSGVGDYRRTHGLDLWKNERCLACCDLPLCFGGCRYLRLLQGGAVDAVDCRKPFFDAALEELMLQDLRLDSPP